MRRNYKSLICRDRKRRVSGRRHRGGGAEALAATKAFFGFFAFTPLSFRKIVGLITDYEKTKDLAGKSEPDRTIGMEAICSQTPPLRSLRLCVR